MDVAIGTLDTPLGTLAYACTPLGLSGLSFHDTPRDRARLRGGLPVVEAPDRTVTVRDRLAAYFSGEGAGFDLPIDWRHTSNVQREVLEKLYAGVSYGRTVTYGELADLSGTGVPARATATASGSARHGAVPAAPWSPVHRQCATSSNSAEAARRSASRPR